MQLPSKPWRKGYTTFGLEADASLSLGVGGSAGHASHAVNDFRKICGFEAYTPTDNVSELTARVNDERLGHACFSEWLRGSRLRLGDGSLIFSVGGGNRGKNDRRWDLRAGLKSGLARRSRTV